MLPSDTSAEWWIADGSGGPSSQRAAAESSTYTRSDADPDSSRPPATQTAPWWAVAATSVSAAGAAGPGSHAWGTAEEGSIGVATGGEAAEGDVAGGVDVPVEHPATATARTTATFVRIGA